MQINTLKPIIIRNIKLFFFLLIFANLKILQSQSQVELFSNSDYKELRIGLNSSFRNASEMYLNDSLINLFYQPFYYKDSSGNQQSFSNAYYNSIYSETEFDIDVNYKITDDLGFYANIPFYMADLKKVNKFDTTIKEQEVEFRRTYNLNQDSLFDVFLVNHITMGFRYYIKNTDKSYFHLFTDFKLALNKVENINSNPNYPFQAPLGNELSFGSALGYKIDNVNLETNILYNYRANDYLDRAIANIRLTLQSIKEANIYVNYNIVQGIGLKDLAENQKLLPSQMPLGYNQSNLGFGFLFDYKSKYILDINYNIMLQGNNTWKKNSVNLNMSYRY